MHHLVSFVSHSFIREQGAYSLCSIGIHLFCFVTLKDCVLLDNPHNLVELITERVEHCENTVSYPQRVFKVEAGT